MKITAIEAIPVCVPLKSGMTAKTAHGEHATSPYVIVKVHTDQGLIGLGEATVSALWSGETQGTVLALIREYLAPALLGRDPRDMTSIRRTMDFLVKLNPFTKSAIEMACWDLAGKS
ncbi:MAG: mandelate racemase/muconate lactonizing protein, partial [Planctomycetaceae bacterium]